MFEGANEANSQQRPKKEFNLLIDIQKKLEQGKGRGYENWATVYNVKQVAQTLLFLGEEAKSSADRFEKLRTQIETVEKRLAEIAVLKTHRFLIQ